MRNKLLIKSVSMLLMLLLLIVITLLQRMSIILLERGILISIICIVIYFTYQYILYDRGLDLFDKRQKRLYSVIDYMQVIVSAFFLMQVIFSFCFFPAEVTQTSMNPNLYEGERIIVVHDTHELNRFDVVVFRVDMTLQVHVNPNEDQELWIKRIIGLPGDNLYFMGGQLYVNGILVHEPHLYDSEGVLHQGGYFDQRGFFHSYNSYTQDITLAEIMALTNLSGSTIPEGYYLLMGDNRANSKDGREIGLVPFSQIIGKGRYIVRHLFEWEKIGV
ncbi:MAG: signal peptidase I [Bacilli bacterium]|nr:signal peptidase I [Bacilli bacterium]